MVEAASGHGTFRCRNVSAGGIAVETGDLLPVGCQVEVYFELPTGVAVEAQATVVRCDGPVVALRFLDLTREEQLALRAHSRISGLHRLDGLQA